MHVNGSYEIKQHKTYQDVTSSNANNTPPTGALKAAATPAAHPQVTFPKHQTDRNEHKAEMYHLFDQNGEKEKKKKNKEKMDK